MPKEFPDIKFKGTLRPSQADVVAIAQKQLQRGQRRLHIVAPPGSGKTILGLFLWAEHIRCPAVVLSPNSAIQSQWAARTSLFDNVSEISMDNDAPGLLTSLTYQAVTMPRRGGSDLDAEAITFWKTALIEKQQAKDPDEAQVWIEDLARHNPEYYEDRLSAYRKQVRDEKAMTGDSFSVLHDSSRETLQRLKKRGVGLIILDECHHLVGHWGRVLSDAHEFFEQPIILGLTATPPDPSGKKPEDVVRYGELLGKVDYEVPVPAVVKDGFLAPYQDLAFFVRPTAEELSFIANADDELHAIVELLCRENEKVEETLTAWVQRVLTDLELPTGQVDDWKSFEKRDPNFSAAAPLFLLSKNLKLPSCIPPPLLNEPLEEIPEMNYLVPVLDRYVRHRLRRSPNPEDHKIAEQVIARLRILGVQITETDCRACASPVGRVLAYSKAKSGALINILKAEMDCLGDTIRAVVITDFEKTSAISADTENLLNEESGGAIAAFRALISDPRTDELDPILVTGSTVLVDDDLSFALLEAAQNYLKERNLNVDLEYVDEDGFMDLRGSGGDWAPRVYVEMITHFFQTGLTKCLVGTRGLLGEGWDASRINVLIDLTTVTTSMSVNQLRGRSIRLDSNDPNKLANNWDVVCLAPEFSKGLDDYTRFKKKHRTMFGLTDDGAIEKGVGHVHPAFTELKPEGVEGSVGMLNADMLHRVNKRSEARAMWKIGEPFHGKPMRAVEVKSGGNGGGFPPFGKANDPWTANSLSLAIGEAVLAALAEAEMLTGKAQVKVSDRAGGYVRAFLQDANEKDSAIFADCMREILGPLNNPRYVIPRYVDWIKDTWLSGILPEVIGQYFQKRDRQMMMLHALPKPLAGKKEIAKLFEKHWNNFVSPGEALYAHKGEGEKLLEEAIKNGTISKDKIHDKEIFI